LARRGPSRLRGRRTQRISDPERAASRRVERRGLTSHVPRAVRLTVCLALLFVTACGSQPSSAEGEPLRFLTLAQSAPGGDGPEHAVVLVASDPKGLAAIDRLLAPDDRVRTANADLSTEIVIGFFAGTVATGGRTLAIDEITVSGNSVRIHATLSVPPPDGAGTQAFTHPYQVIEVSRDRLPAPIRGSWVLREEGGSVIARGDIS
jgi:protease stability complex PrcB-like protein